MDLLEIRKELDILDREIVHLFEKRMGLVEDVARFKLDTGKAVLDSKREKKSCRWQEATWRTLSCRNPLPSFFRK